MIVSKVISFLTFLMCVLACVGAYYGQKDYSFQLARADKFVLGCVAVAGLNSLYTIFA